MLCSCGRAYLRAARVGGEPTVLAPQSRELRVVGVLPSLRATAEASAVVAVQGRVVA